MCDFVILMQDNTPNKRVIFLAFSCTKSSELPLSRPGTVVHGLAKDEKHHRSVIVILHCRDIISYFALSFNKIRLMGNLSSRYF
jgi:hypothetical protein